MKLRVSVPIRGGYKVIARQGKTVQEVFVLSTLEQSELEQAIAKLLWCNTPLDPPPFSKKGWQGAIANAKVILIFIMEICGIMYKSKAPHYEINLSQKTFLVKYS